MDESLSILHPNICLKRLSRQIYQARTAIGKMSWTRITFEYRSTTGSPPRKLFAQPLSARIVVRFKETFAKPMRTRAGHEAVQLICTCLLCIGHTLYTQLCPCNVDHASSSPLQPGKNCPVSLCRTGTREKRRSKEVSLDTHVARK